MSRSVNERCATPGGWFVNTQTLFKHLTDVLIRAFEVDPSRQRIGSTAIRSAIRILNRFGIIVETLSKVLREVATFTRRSMTGWTQRRFVSMWSGKVRTVLLWPAWRIETPPTRGGPGIMGIDPAIRKERGDHPTEL
jgi:hypothetical protein